MKILKKPQSRMSINRSLLKEGITQGVIKDIIQFLVGASAEYGITIATGGTGVEGAVAAETFIDSLFAISSIESSITGIKELSSEAAEFADTIQATMKSASNIKENPKQFYTNVNQLLAKFFQISKNNADEIKEKFLEVIDKLVQKLTDSTVAGIKVLIPDAAIGEAVGTAIRVVISSATEKPFDTAISSLEKAGKLKDFILEPGKAADFFESLAKQIIELLGLAADKIEDTSWMTTIAATIATALQPGFIAIKALGPTGCRNAAKQIESSLPDFIVLVNKIVGMVIPALFGVLAILQSLKNNDYVDNEEKKTESLIRSFVKMQLQELSSNH